ncbi:hypothetical protein SAMN02745121_05770 [Nannocystis exedens]|uniref:Uncharacterized protein n=1 Tax=Nannocystis exedens TaxID=54 RepID=A0A1I2DWT3_9BACT|nr:hypothetical protein [Nannocystis exedens]PCC69122.1 hypothetical protein NAEX_02144 [Nannocystis exedens]SFE85084.1 hypothetical protein SAMN02745121_05770 [Nannocystis exedens]
MSEPRLERYRQRFRSAPVGEWRQALGSFPFMNQVWTIEPDHTGAMEWRSGSGVLRSAFEWQEVGDYHIRVRCLEVADGEPTNEAEPEEREPDPWIDLRYEFSLGTDGDLPGVVVLLHEVGRAGFWWSEDPLMLRGE